ncbi:MAG: hypothetical protein P1V97_07480 [Planctomycetota bacterium]|nr:hypothetical protein [Planctomycetota bacterium]
MKIINAAAMDPYEHGHSSRQPIASWILFLSLASAATAGLYYFAYQGGYQSPKVDLPPGVLYGVAGVITLFLLIFIADLKKRFASTNWLIKVTPSNIYLHFRSYRNGHLPPEDLTILALDKAEVASLREHKVHEISRRHNGSKTKEHSWKTYLEIELNEDLDLALEALLARESDYLGLTERESTVRSAWKHCPVNIKNPRRLAVEFYGRPNAKNLLKEISQEWPVLEKLSTTKDHT